MPQSKKRSVPQPHMDELYKSLGYGKVESPERFKQLDGNIHAYFTTYEKQVRILGSRETLSDEILFCARTYLTERSRGANFWPDNSRGIPAWSNNEQFIFDIVCHILRRKGKASDVSRCIARKKAREHEDAPQIKQSAKSGKRKRRDDSDDDNVGFPERLEGLSETTVKPWNEPPKGPDPRFCGQYIQSLNPNADVTKVSGFTLEWLTTSNSQWPEMADVKLQTFMHNRRFYLSDNYAESPPLDLITILTKGSEIENVDEGFHFIEFKNRIRDRVEFLTHRLTKAPYVVLEIRHDGAAQMVRRFATMWKRKEEYWEVDAADLFPAQFSSVILEPKQKPNKRRRLNGPRKSKSPVAFPNLCVHRSTSEKPGLVSMAETALQMATLESEHDQMADENTHDFDDQVAMFASRTSADPSHMSGFSRSTSPEDNVLIDNGGISTEGSPKTTPDLSPLRKDSWDALHRDLVAGHGDIPSDREIPGTDNHLSTPSLERPLSCTSSASLTKLPLVCNQVISGSNRECGFEILDDRSDDEDSRHSMIVEETGNTKFLKVEPGSDALHSCGVVADHHHSFQSLSLSRQPTPVEPMQLRHFQVVSIARKLRASLLDLDPSSSLLPSEPCSNAVVDPGDNLRLRVATPVSPSLPDLIHSEPTPSPERVSGNPRIPTSPSMNSSASPEGPQRTLDKILSPPGNQLVSSKQVLPADSHTSALSPKERRRAEKRADVLVQAAEWECIRSHELKSQTRTPPLMLATSHPQPRDMPPPPKPAVVSVRNEKMASTARIDTSSAHILSKSSNVHTQINQPARTAADCRGSILSPSDECQTITSPVKISVAGPQDLSKFPFSQPRPLGCSPATAFRNANVISVSTPPQQNTQARNLPHNSKLTSSVSPTASKVGIPSLYTTLYLGTSSAEGCVSPARLAREEQIEASPIASFTDPSPPLIAQSMQLLKTSAHANLANIPEDPKPTSESGHLLPSSENTSTPISPSRLIGNVRFQSTPVTSLVQQPQTLSTFTRTLVPPTSITSEVNTRNTSPPDQISSNLNLNMSIAAASAWNLAAQTTEFLKRNDRGDPPIESASNILEAVGVETSRPQPDDMPPPHSGAYAHVPESAPFSARPSEEEILTLQALQIPYGRVPLKSSIEEERSIVKSTFQSSRTKTLELLIESADGEMNLETGYSFDVVMNNNVQGFFSFYSAVSKAPLETFQELIFTPTWPKCSTLRATKQMGEPGWKKLKKMLQAWYKKAQKDDPEEMEFQIMVQMA